MTNLIVLILYKKNICTFLYKFSPVQTGWLFEIRELPSFVDGGSTFYIIVCSWS
jgi:hypothetical protein